MPEQRIGGADLNEAKNSVHFAQQVGVSEHHAFGIGGGAGSVEQGGDIVGGCLDGAEVAGSGGEDGVKIGNPARLAWVFFGVFESARIDEEQVNFKSADCLLRDGEMLHISHQQGSATVFEELGDLVGVESGIERYSRVAGGNGAQVRRYPARVVVGKDGDARAGREILFCQPAAHGFGHLARFRVCIALHLVVALDFEGNVLGSALLGFDKLVVESGH